MFCIITKKIILSYVQTHYLRPTIRNTNSSEQTSTAVNFKLKLSPPATSRLTHTNNQAPITKSQQLKRTIQINLTTNRLTKTKPELTSTFPTHKHLPNSTYIRLLVLS